MKILVKSYADFKATANAIGELKAVLYWDGAQASPPIAGQFSLTALVDGGRVAVHFSHGTQGTTPETTLPTSFLADFPTAVRLESNYEVC